jgi:hypothetical protein
MKRGDLVVAHYDEERGIECIGLVLETRRAEVRKYSNSKRERRKSNVVVASTHRLDGGERIS